MNRENILKVADAIEQHSIPDLGFNMDWLETERIYRLSGHREIVRKDNTGRDCGTIACIAGWACRLAGVPANFGSARKFLGIPENLRDPLFYAHGSAVQDRLEDIQPQTAVAVLRHLAETGEVDWNRALAAPVSP